MHLKLNWEKLKSLGTFMDSLRNGTRDRLRSTGSLLGTSRKIQDLGPTVVYLENRFVRKDAENIYYKCQDVATLLYT